MTSTDDLAAHHGRAADRHPVAWPGLTKVVWAEWLISETPDVSRADAASRKGR
jgi:hypothetical protein